MLLNVNKLRRLLLDKEHCPEEMLPSIIKKIENFSPDTLSLLDQWIETGKIKDFSMMGITSKWLRENKDMKDIGMLIAYDWIVKEGEAAVKSLKEPLY
jgi:hypothetical protein